MRPEEQRPEQQPEEITDLPIREATDAAGVADKIKGGDGLTPPVSNILKTTHDTAQNSISNVR